MIEIHPPDPDKKSICLISEGAYPYVTGGVSSWIQDIISGLHDFNFIIYAISSDENQEVKYEFPENVVGLINRILTEPTKKHGKNIKNSFFKRIISFHREIIKKKDFSSLEWILEHIREQRYSLENIYSHIDTWNMVSDYNRANNPLYPFSDYFWAWRASHEYLIKILTWEIPEADLYHTISTGYAGFTAAVSKLIYKKPVLLTEHGLYNKEREIDIKRATWVQGYQRDLWINIFNDLSRITYNYSDLTISLFDQNRNIQISQGADKKKTMVIPNGIDIDKYLDLKTENREDFSVGIVARVVPIKDVKNFIIAAKIISEKIDRIKFYIIGPQDEDIIYYEECLQLADNYKIKEKVIFTGKADVREYYKFIDILVLSSIREAQPLVILEAYCAGIPVVSTRVGNVPEMLDYDEDLLADPKDSEKLAKGILKIYNDTDYRNNLVEKNRDKVLKFYNKRDLIAKYRELYNQHITEGSIQGSNNP